MPIIERETICFVYYAARESMDHDTAVRHAADECRVSREDVEQSLALEIAEA